MTEYAEATQPDRPPGIETQIGSLFLALEALGDEVGNVESSMKPFLVENDEVPRESEKIAAAPRYSDLRTKIGRATDIVDSLRWRLENLRQSIDN